MEGRRHQASQKEEVAERARTFWEWFGRTASRLRNLEPGKPEWDELDAHVRALGLEAWEVGPAVASEAEYSFALSPMGDPEVYELCKEIVALAPAVPGWELLPAKPRKQWHRKFLWSDTGVEVDAGSWRFVVYRYDDGMSEIELLGDVMPQIEEADRTRVVEFVVESELGEGLCMEKLCGLEIEPNPSEEDLENSIPIENLFLVVSGRSDIH